MTTTTNKTVRKPRSDRGIRKKPETQFTAFRMSADNVRRCDFYRKEVAVGSLSQLLNEALRRYFDEVLP